MSEPAVGGYADPFHAGEHAAQAHAGVQPFRAPIRDYMPDQHRHFFAALPFLPIAGVDAAGWPIATILSGPAGFISSPDARTLRLAARPQADDPILPHLVENAPLGLLGIDLRTRRRNRANGRVRAVETSGFTVAVSESFGNCPQYIQAREIREADTPLQPLEIVHGLDGAARTLIGRADTFFVASSAGAGTDRGGVDISHRGGKPGFVRIDGQTLTIPDFRGNRYFNTLGNFVLNPRAALLFVDFVRGDVLQLAGQVEILWDRENAADFQGAERLWRVHVSHGWRRPSALPLRWSFLDYAPTTEATGRWSSERGLWQERGVASLGQT